MGAIGSPLPAGLGALPSYGPRHPSIPPQKEGKKMPQLRGLADRILSLPDKHPKLRFVFDITIIAISVLSSAALITATGGSGLFLIGLIPTFAIGALGTALLISDIAETGSIGRLIEKVLAIASPVIFMLAASALIAGAVAASGATIFVFMNPLFYYGLISVGFSFLAISHFVCPAVESCWQNAEPTPIIPTDAIQV